MLSGEQWKDIIPGKIEVMWCNYVGLGCSGWDLATVSRYADSQPPQVPEIRMQMLPKPNARGWGRESLFEVES